jgi:tetratricopeptide (TPR) repeat protein
MGPAFEQAKGDLADRLMAALEAAEAAGGDVRGRQSAALLVTSADRTPNAWEGQRFDLHVEDHPRPLEELRRLLDIHRAYAMFEEARVLIGDGRVEESLVLVERALAIRPGEPQFTFWTGLALANLGRDAEARSFLKQSFEANEGWRQLGLSLKSIGFYSGDPALLEA